MFDNINAEFIDQMIDKIQKSGLGKIVVQQGDTILTLESKKENIRYTHTPSAMPETASPATNGNVPSETPAVVQGHVIKSPIVGTFYSSPSPEKPPFVTVGTKVKKGDVLFIIESMKLMNEVTSEYNGTVSKISVNNGEAIEFGQEIMIIE